MLVSARKRTCVRGSAFIQQFFYIHPFTTWSQPPSDVHSLQFDELTYLLPPLTFSPLGHLCPLLCLCFIGGGLGELFGAHLIPLHV